MVGSFIRFDPLGHRCDRVLPVAVPYKAAETLVVSRDEPRSADR
jgi:hypothetical protein